MPIIDDRTETLDLALPHVENDMQDDVERLRAALSGVDTWAAAVILELAGKAAQTHNHPLSQVNGLENALSALAEGIAGRSVLGHTHTLGALSDVDAAGATSGQFFKRVGLLWVPATPVIADVSGLTTALGQKADLLGNSIIVPSGPESGRPVTPIAKVIRYNETNGSFEGWDGSKWGKIGGGATVSETAPATPVNGDLWLQTSSLTLFLFYHDGDSGQWVSLFSGFDILACLLRGNNLSDLSSAPAARTNLGANSNGSDIFTSATAIGRLLALATDAAAARAAIGAPSAPMGSAAGVGQVIGVSPGSGSGIVLPAGGTWLYHVIAFNSSGTASGGSNAGVAAGGSTPVTGVAGILWIGFIWRIA